MTTYATLQEVKDQASMADAVDDAVLSRILESASRAVDTYCERRFFTAGTETRLYVADSALIIDIDDVAGTALTLRTSSSSDGVFDTTWTDNDVQCEPLNRQASGMTFPVNRLRAVGDYLFPQPYGRTTYRGRANVQVTAVFGFGTAVPAAVTEATILLISRLFSRRNSPQGIVGWGDMGAVRVTQSDPDVRFLLSSYRRYPVASA